MKKKVDKYKFTIITLSFVFALSLTVTIVLAAFNANKSGSVTLNFADGLTMALVSKGGSGTVRITGGGVNDYTFTYAPQTNVTSNVKYDGIIATLNKDGWVSYQIELYETTSGSAIAPQGAWSGPSSKGLCTFIPQGSRTNWVVATTPTAGLFNVTTSNNLLTCVGKVKWQESNSTLTADLFDGYHFRNSNGSSATRSYVDDLSGRSFEVHFTIKANTESSPTF